MMSRESKNFWRYLHDFFKEMRGLEERHITMLGIGEIHSNRVEYNIRLTKEFSCFITKALEISNLSIPSTFFVMEMDFSRIPESCVAGRLDIWSDSNRNFTFDSTPSCSVKQIFEQKDAMEAMDRAYDMILKAALTFEYAQGLTRADSPDDYKTRFKRITGKEAKFFNTMSI
jgi:hypothetical protein